MKGLEALQDLSKMVFVYGGVEQYKIIEKELKEYEELESMHEELAKAYNKLCQEKIEWLKQKKALENIKDIVKNNISEWGNVDFNINDYPLLKEVLL